MKQRTTKMHQIIKLNQSNTTLTQRETLKIILHKIFPNPSSISKINKDIILSKSEIEVLNNFTKDFYQKLTKALNKTEPAKINDILHIFTSGHHKNELTLIFKTAFKDNLSFLSFFKNVGSSGILGVAAIIGFSSGSAGIIIGIICVAAALLIMGNVLLHGLKKQYGWLLNDVQALGDLLKIDDEKSIEIENLNLFSPSRVAGGSFLTNLYNKMADAANTFSPIKHEKINEDIGFRREKRANLLSF